MKALVGAFNQEKALVGAFYVIVQPVVEPMDRFTALNRDNLPWDHICWAAENVKPILSKYPQYPGTQPPPTAGAGQVHRDGRTLTAGLINDTEMCLCVSETPFMNIQWTHLDIVKLELHVADASER